MSLATFKTARLFVSTAVTVNERLGFGLVVLGERDFIYYGIPLGMGKEALAEQFVELVIASNSIHEIYAKEFIDFFYKYHKDFNESQIKRIASILERIIRPDLVISSYRAIGLYGLKKFTPALRTYLPKNALVKMKESLKERGRIDNFRDLHTIYTIANLDASVQDSLLNLIAYGYKLIQEEDNVGAKERRKFYLYGIIVPHSLQYLVDYQETISRTLFLLDEDTVFEPHGDQPGTNCAYDYYYDLIVPRLVENKRSGNYMGKIHPNNPIKGFFEDHRTPELMRAALIEFGIIEK